ncbi:MAG: hypothetical protein GX803_08340 [Lentisphaerae bacterium]|jgi:hypothetical protein|nr:hypothetical protein [Lentisphaerota bacterium]
MKGFTHFMSGVAVASFGPWAVEAALQGNPLFFVLGGACGILPDTIDFKFYRFFYHHDVYVEPDPNDLDPQYVADEFARAIAIAVDEKRYVNLKLSSVRLGADFWQQYSVKIDNETQEVLVKFGAVVNTGQVPVEGTENLHPAIARAPLKTKVVQTYDAALKVDIFDGPTLGFKPLEDGTLDLEFLPWHREWSHSLTMGAFLGLLWMVGAMLWAGLPGSPALAEGLSLFGAIKGMLGHLFSHYALAWQGFVTIAACYGVHVVEDQLGHMGSNIFYPITKLRTPGLQWMHSGDGLPNFLTVWISCLLIFWNLYRGQDQMSFHFTFIHLMMVGLVIPGVLFWALRKILTYGQTIKVHKGDDADDEWNEMKAAGA